MLALFIDQHASSGRTEKVSGLLRRHFVVAWRWRWLLQKRQWEWKRKKCAFVWKKMSNKLQENLSPSHRKRYTIPSRRRRDCESSTFLSLDVAIVSGRRWPFTVKENDKNFDYNSKVPVESFAECLTLMRILPYVLPPHRLNGDGVLSTILFRLRIDDSVRNFMRKVRPQCIRNDSQAMKYNRFN